MSRFHSITRKPHIPQSSFLSDSPILLSAFLRCIERLKARNERLTAALERRKAESEQISAKVNKLEADCCALQTALRYRYTSDTRTQACLHSCSLSVIFYDVCQNNTCSHAGQLSSSINLRFPISEVFFFVFVVD